MDKGLVSTSIPWNLLELLPGSHLEIAKYKYNMLPTTFCLKAHIVSYHNNSLVPGDDKRPAILEET